jgi:1,4-dihydroxy-6-naphthoate synthase
MVNGRIDTEGLSFDTTLADIENLNNYALQNKFDIIKISYAFYPKISDKYQILDSGSALGYGNGPILVSKYPIDISKVESIQVAIPGINTTANFLLSIAFPGIQKKIEIIFSDIEDAVISGRVDAGLLIHEGRFTYQKKGLKLIADLGKWWEQHTNLAIPLGGIMIKRALPEKIKISVNKILKNSISHAFRHPLEASAYIKANAQEMDNDVIHEHIKLYVNEYSLDLGPKGRKAIENLFEKALGLHKSNSLTQPIFAI